MVGEKTGLNDDLLRAIENARSRVSKHRRVYQKNEEAVKQHIISEFFEALQWNWRDPDEVYPEDVTYSKARADYALKVKNVKVAFVEVKNLSINVLSDEKSLTQLAHYCADEGVAYGILTNGLQWRAIKAFEAGRPVPERELFSVDLFRDSIGRSYLYLSLLTKSNIVQLESLTQKLRDFESIINDLNNTFSYNELSIILNSSFTKTPPSEVSFPPKNALTLSKIHNPQGDNPPSRVYILSPKGNMIVENPKKRKWRAILRAALRGLLELGISDDKLEIPHYVSTQRSKINAKDRYVDVVTVGNRTVYVFGAIGSTRIIELLRELEHKSGVRFALEF